MTKLPAIAANTITTITPSDNPESPDAAADAPMQHTSASFELQGEPKQMAVVFMDCVLLHSKYSVHGWLSITTGAGDRVGVAGVGVLVGSLVGSGAVISTGCGVVD